MGRKRWPHERLVGWRLRRLRQGLPWQCKYGADGQDEKKTQKHGWVRDVRARKSGQNEADAESAGASMDAQGWTGFGKQNGRPR